MSRTEGARDDPARAAKKLSERAFQSDIRLTAGQMDTLNQIAYGRGVSRHSRTILGAIRTKLEWGHAKPEQRHELSGNVTITVQSPVPTRAAFLKAKAIPVANVGTLEAVEVAANQANQGQRPIMAIMSTQESAEQRDISSEASADIDAVGSVPTVALTHEDGRLLGAPDTRTAEERRHDEREAWRAEQEALRWGGDGA